MNNWILPSCCSFRFAIKHIENAQCPKVHNIYADTILKSAPRVLHTVLLKTVHATYPVFEF